ncbi:hypothetical protein F5051DRAFT_485719 [Lentinula edodes]|nr:hypothetical protein F5051DRAFT_485719 [Lentinula edodes]
MSVVAVAPFLFFPPRLQKSLLVRETPGRKISIDIRDHFTLDATVLFHTIVSRLVVGVCLLKFVAVGAIPTGSGKAPLGKTLVPGKVVDPYLRRNGGNKWREVDWIDVKATDLNNQLEGKLTLGRLSGFAPIEGNNNKGIYTLFNGVKVNSIPGSSLVALATLQQQQHKAPLFVTSGHMMHKKVKRCYHSAESTWNATAGYERLERREQNYDLVQTKKLVHIDPDPSNILVDHPEANLLDANLIDYGAPLVYPVKRDITMEEFEMWFKERWDFLWFHEGS